MKKEKNVKIMTILFLCIAVVGLAVGFAAFSNTLKISSSATVTPNKSDFNINVYGVEDIDGAVENYYYSLDNFEAGAYTSLDVSNPYVVGNNGFGGVKSATPAKITNDGEIITISDINVEYSEPNQSAVYYFMIINEGAYDAYLNSIEGFSDHGFVLIKECVPGENTNAYVVERSCSQGDMTAVVNFVTSDYNSFEVNDKLAKGDFIYMTIFFDYSDTIYLADGPFTVEFEDVILNFTSTPPSA